ncbi:MAG: hypothetical protein JSV24_11455 [Bacteroidales bacterium]|nr:MAG: hypothetical protein JSV24_11455 [Bacteroidales bacterium]
MQRILCPTLLLTFMLGGCEKDEPCDCQGDSEWYLIFEDDFEAYATGTHPAVTWTTRFTGESAEISEEVAYAGSKSFRLTSEANWARVEAVPMGILPDSLLVEGAIYLTQPDRGYVLGFGFKESSNTYRYRNSIAFTNENKIAFQYDLCTWNPDTWYHIKMEYDFARMKSKVWINNQVVGENLDLSDKSEMHDFILGGLNFTSGTSTAYYDNIRIYAKCSCVY